MQRRSGKRDAHISISSLPRLSTGSDRDFDPEKPSRLNQRTLGLTHRIWLILALFLCIIAFTRIILPHDSSLPRHGLTNPNLRPKNYLNTSDTESIPFAFCPVFGPGDDLGAKHGIHALTKSRLHLGSGARVQRVIHKAMAGLPVTISVLGGSISACHGAGDDPISPKCYPSRFFQWWNSVFPHPASELTNGAMRRTNSAYFSYCNAHHLPDVTDLVIVEFDTDDPNDEEWLEHFELLIRSILLRQDQPAVIILGHFSPQVQETHGFHGPEALHSVVAQFYDVPHISIKPTLYPQWVSNPDSITNLYTDPILANPSGHELLAEHLISYIQTQVCAAWSSVTGHTYDIVSPFISLADGANNKKEHTDARALFGGVGIKAGIAPADYDIEFRGGGGSGGGGSSNPHLHPPAARIRTRPNADASRTFEEVKPYCVAANDLINPLPPSLFYGSGWHVYHPPPGTTRSSISSSTIGLSHYWYSTLPTSKLRVPLQVGAGDIAVYYVKEPRESVEGYGSAVECWVDDNYGGAVVLANAADDVTEPTPVLEVIDHYVSRGSHYVECKLLGEEGRGVPPFKLLGIFTT